MGEQIEPPAQGDELATRRPDRRAVVLPEVGDGLEVRRQTPGQPHHLDVALRLPLQPPARGDLVDVAVDVDLQERARVIGRPARRLRDHALEPPRPKVQLTHEHVDHPDRVLLRHIVIQIFRKQDALPAVLALDETLHPSPRSSCSRILRQCRSRRNRPGPHSPCVFPHPPPLAGQTQRLPSRPVWTFSDARPGSGRSEGLRGHCQGNEV